MAGGSSEPRGDRHAAGTWTVTSADNKESSEREMIPSLTFMSGNSGDFQPAEPPPPTKLKKQSTASRKKQSDD